MLQCNSTISRHITFTPRALSHLEFGRFQSDYIRLPRLGCNIAQSQRHLSCWTKISCLCQYIVAFVRK
jgi:hypothetical protein